MIDLGQAFTYFSLSYLVFLLIILVIFFLFFIPGELYMLYLRRKGHPTARTLSQYVVKKAKEGVPFFKELILAMPAIIAALGIFLAITGIWLVLHFEAFCIHWGVLCNIDI